MSTYIYIRTEPQVWTVGFYKPSGEFEPESDHEYKENAALRVNFLNGGVDGTILDTINRFCLSRLEY